MAIFNRRKKRSQCMVGFSSDDSLCVSGYTSLDKNPEIVAGVRQIAQQISSMTIYLMSNTEKGDKRIINELSRAVDISPCKNMTRRTWMDAIVMNLLLYGKGNSVVWPHTSDGYLGDLEPIAASRVSFKPIGKSDYKIAIDGVEHNPEDMLHFVHNPDKDYPWKGQGFNVSLKDVADNLKQAAATEKGFMSSKWKPSIIVKVDALIDEFSNPEGRKKLLESYAKSGDAGEPWLIPAEQFDVQQVKPLTLADLAIADVVKLNKQTVAAILGVPPFVLGVGEYKKDAWDSFVNNTIRPIAQEIEQELTKKLLISPKWYWKFNIRKLYSYDLNTIKEVYGAFYDKGIVNKNETRNEIGLEPVEGGDEFFVLENYIPASKSGEQKKLNGGGTGED